MKKLVTPIVNRNGSSCKGLVTENMDVVRKLLDLKEAINSIMPHGRDYQIEGLLTEARSAMLERYSAINVMIAEFEAHTIEIFKQEEN